MVSECSLLLLLVAEFAGAQVLSLLEGEASHEEYGLIGAELDVSMVKRQLCSAGAFAVSGGDVM